MTRRSALTRLSLAALGVAAGPAVVEAAAPVAKGWTWAGKVIASWKIEIQLPWGSYMSWSGFDKESRERAWGNIGMHPEWVGADVKETFTYAK